MVDRAANGDRPRDRRPAARRAAQAPAPEVGRHGDLQIDDQPDFQRLCWKLQRAGWGLIVLVLLAALLGLFGGGPLSRAVVGDHFDPVRAEYERFARLQAPGELQVHVRAGAGREGVARVWLSRSYLDAIGLERVVPRPERVEAGADRVVYVVRLAEPDGPATLTFAYKPRRFGPLTGHVGLGDGPPLRFAQFVYP